MKKQFTPQYIRDNKGCYSTERVNSLSFISKPEIDILDIINSEMPIKDKFWWVRNKCGLDLKQKQLLALGCAKVVLPIYEAKYKEDYKVRECVEATDLFISGSITRGELLTHRNAAADAADAAYAAADAAAAAAYAADAAAAAADAAADAAAAAADAAADAAAAAAARNSDNTYQEQLLSFLIDFVNNQP